MSPASRTKKPAASRTKKPAAKPARPSAKPAAKPAKTTSAKKPAGAKAAPKADGARSPAPRRPAARADLGAPIDGFFAKQPPHLRAILEALRMLVAEAAPDATSSLKWGMPFFEVAGNIVCAIAGFKSHVNLILPGAPGVLSDPKGRLSGEGKTGRHLKLRALDELPRDEVRGWLRVTTQRARDGLTER